MDLYELNLSEFIAIRNHNKPAFYKCLIKDKEILCTKENNTNEGKVIMVPSGIPYFLHKSYLYNEMVPTNIRIVSYEK